MIVSTWTLLTLDCFRESFRNFFRNFSSIFFITSSSDSLGNYSKVSFGSSSRNFYKNFYRNSPRFFSCRIVFICCMGTFKNLLRILLRKSSMDLKKKSPRFFQIISSFLFSVSFVFRNSFVIFFRHFSRVNVSNYSRNSFKNFSLYSFTEHSVDFFQIWYSAIPLENQILKFLQKFVESSKRKFFTIPSKVIFIISSRDFSRKCPRIFSRELFQKLPPSFPHNIIYSLNLSKIAPKDPFRNFSWDLFTDFYRNYSRSSFINSSKDNSGFVSSGSSKDSWSLGI